MVGLCFQSCYTNVIVFVRLLLLLLRASLFKLVIPADIRRIASASVLRIRNLRQVGVSSLGLRLFLCGFYFCVKNEAQEHKKPLQMCQQGENSRKTGRKYIFKGLDGDF